MKNVTEFVVSIFLKLRWSVLVAKLVLYRQQIVKLPLKGKLSKVH